MDRAFYFAIKRTLSFNSSLNSSRSFIVIAPSFNNETILQIQLERLILNCTPVSFLSLRIRSSKAQNFSEGLPSPVNIFFIQFIHIGFLPIGYLFSEQGPVFFRKSIFWHVYNSPSIVKEILMYFIISHIWQYWSNVQQYTKENGRCQTQSWL